MVDRIRDPVPALGFRQSGKVGPEGGVENLNQPVPRGEGPKIRGKNRLDGAPRGQEGSLGHGQQLFTEENDSAFIDRFQAEDGQKKGQFATAPRLAQTHGGSFLYVQRNRIQDRVGAFDRSGSVEGEILDLQHGQGRLVNDWRRARSNPLGLPSLE